MSAIDKLKNGSGIISFDATAPANTGKTVKAGEAMDIDMTGGSDSVSVEAPAESSEMNLGNLRKGNHQIVLPKEKNVAPAASRTVASIDIIGTPEAPDEDIHISPEHDMLDIDNPDSMFSKYVAKKDAEAALKAFTEVVGEELKKGEKIQLVGFGTFEVSERAERTGRNPQTGMEMTIPASKAPKFKAGKALKDIVNA